MSGQPPCPLKRGDRGLVAAVDVGALVAVHLYRDEVLVDDARHLGIVVGLVVHHVTPVAPHRADIEQDGLVLALRRGEGLLAPLMPVDGLVHGRAQIRRSRLRERVGGHKRTSLQERIDAEGVWVVRRKFPVEVLRGPLEITCDMAIYRQLRFRWRRLRIYTEIADSIRGLR